MNQSELKIKSYLENNGFKVEDEPEITTPEGIKKLDFKVYVNGWFLIEVTNPELSDKGKFSLEECVAVVGNMNRLQSKLNNKYYDQIKGADIDCPVVVIIDTEGSELGLDPTLDILNMARMPEVSAVVNYNRIHLNISDGIGFIKINESAKYKLNEEQIKILKFS